MGVLRVCKRKISPDRAVRDPIAVLLSPQQLSAIAALLSPQQLSAIAAPLRKQQLSAIVAVLSQQQLSAVAAVLIQQQLSAMTPQNQAVVLGLGFLTGIIDELFKRVWKCHVDLMNCCQVCVGDFVIF